MKRRFPLPLMPIKAPPCAAHGRAPGADTYCEQAGPEGTAESYDHQWSGSGN